MNNEEAVKILESIKTDLYDSGVDEDNIIFGKDIKAINFAIKVLKERPIENITVLCENADEKAIADMKEELQKVIDDLRPKGEWGEPFEHLGNTYHKCPYCCFGIKISDYDNFCPNCGADMRKGDTE